MGFLHVRDMHFLPGALKAAKDSLSSEGPHPESGGPSGGPLGAPQASGGPCTTEGLVAVPEGTEGWIDDVSDVLKVGDLLSLRIRSIDREKRRMRLTTVPCSFQGQAPPLRKAIGSFWVSWCYFFCG